jgi:hypothetical protein
MADDKNKVKKTLLRNKQMTIDEFISIKGGVSSLNKIALERKYAKEKKKAEDWMKLLVQLTILSKSDESFLNREID